MIARAVRFVALLFLLVLGACKAPAPAERGRVGAASWGPASTQVTVGGTKMVACSCSSPADGGVVACSLADAGVPQSCYLVADPGNTATLYVSTAANVTATAGVNQGIPIYVANGVGVGTWTIAPGQPYIAAPAGAAAQTAQCQCAVQ
jgi:hypothetical protein